MENNEAPTPYIKCQFKNKLIEFKPYQLKFENDFYNLLIELYSDNNIYFKLRNSNNFPFSYYTNKFGYEEITKLFLLNKDHYGDLTKVFKFFDIALSKNKINLEYDKNNDKMILKSKRLLDFDEIECKLELNKDNLSNEELFKIIFEQLNNIKNNKNENDSRNEKEEKIKELISKNIENENKIKHLENKIKNLEDLINIMNNKEHIIKKLRKI